MAEEDIKEVLFGRVKTTPTQKFEPDLEDLRRPFEDKDSVAYCFCSGCGLLQEINAAGAEKMARVAGKGVFEPGQDYFFVASGCSFCLGTPEPVELRKLN